MTVAICLRCGEFKHGTADPCPKCGYTPDNVQSWAKQQLATDHYHSREELQALAARVKSGEPVKFDPEKIHAGWVRIEVARLTTSTGRDCQRSSPTSACVKASCV